jgi:hypothetical protein
MLEPSSSMLKLFLYPSCTGLSGAHKKCWHDLDTKMTLALDTNFTSIARWFSNCRHDFTLSALSIGRSFRHENLRSIPRVNEFRPNDRIKDLYLRTHKMSTLPSHQTCKSDSTQQWSRATRTFWTIQIRGFQSISYRLLKIYLRITFNMKTRASTTILLQQDVARHDLPPHPKHVKYRHSYLACYHLDTPTWDQALL